MEAPPHAMRLGDTEQDYYRLGPSFAAAQPADLLSMLARSKASDGGASSAAGGEQAAKPGQEEGTEAGGGQ